MPITRRHVTRLLKQWPHELLAVEWPPKCWLEAIPHPDPLGARQIVEARTRGTLEQASEALRDEAELYKDREGPPVRGDGWQVRRGKRRLRRVIAVENRVRRWWLVERPEAGWFVAPAAPIGRGRPTVVPARDYLLVQRKHALRFCQSMKRKRRATKALPHDWTLPEAKREAKRLFPGSLFGAVSLGGDVRLAYADRALDVSFWQFATGDFDARVLADSLTSALFAFAAGTLPEPASGEAVRKARQPGRRRGLRGR